MRAYSTVQQLLCHGSYCELILSLAPTSCRLLFTAHPFARPLAGNLLRDAVRSRNPSKSTLAHDAVATAVLHKHHLIIRVGAGLIQFVYRSLLRLATEVTRSRNAFLPFFARVLNLTHFKPWKRFQRESTVFLIWVEKKVVGYVRSHAGSRIKFAPGKSLWFSKKILGILLSEFHFTVFLPLGCGVNSWRVSWRATRDSLLAWRATRGVAKSWGFEGKIRWNEFCPFHEITGFTLIRSLRIRILREFRESRDFSCEQIWSCDRHHKYRGDSQETPQLPQNKWKTEKNTWNLWSNSCGARWRQG